jgi:hypothetical protein
LQPDGAGSFLQVLQFGGLPGASPAGL